MCGHFGIEFAVVSCAQQEATDAMERFAKPACHLPPLLSRITNRQTIGDRTKSGWASFVVIAVRPCVTHTVTRLQDRPAWPGGRGHNTPSRRPMTKPERRPQT